MPAFAITSPKGPAAHAASTAPGNSSEQGHHLPPLRSAIHQPQRGCGFSAQGQPSLSEATLGFRHHDRKANPALRLVGQDSVVTKSQILSREKSPISMMPEGLLKTLREDEVRDLIAYLRTTAQVPLPKE